MLIKFKRIYSYYIELFALLVTGYFIYEFMNMGLLIILKDSLKVSTFMYMYVRWFLFSLILIYLVLRNVFSGQSILQKLYGIKYEYKNRKSLMLKNVFDLMTLPVSFLTVLIFNRTIGDIIFKVSIKKVESDNRNANTIFYMMVGWFTIMPLILCIAFSWRVNKSEQLFVFYLNNTQTVEDNVGMIKKFSFDNKIFWTQYDKDGKYTSATIINSENKKIKIKIYYSNDDTSYDYFIIDGQRYDYEIEHFDLEQYAEFVEEFNDEIKVNEIKNEKEAFKEAQSAYEKKFSRNSKKYVNYEIFYDSKNSCYMIHYVSSINGNVLGGDYSIIVREDGQVLAMWAGK